MSKKNVEERERAMIEHLKTFSPEERRRTYRGELAALVLAEERGDTALALKYERHLEQLLEIWDDLTAEWATWAEISVRTGIRMLGDEVPIERITIH